MEIKFKRLNSAIITGYVLIVFFSSVFTCCRYDERHADKSEKEPVYEIFPKDEIQLRRRLFSEIQRDTDATPIVAIIIDDMGNHTQAERKLLSLNGQLTFSIIPFSPFQDKIAAIAEKNGMEVMLHLPMEPVEYPKVNPGKHALMTTMTPQQVVEQLRKNLDAIPNAKGVNNHMGSKMTGVFSHMYQILSVIKKRDLFYIDSLTNPKSLCRTPARLLQLPFAERDIFLDHVQQPEVIRRQLRRLVNVAVRHGEAVGIAHPYTATYRVLSEMMPWLKTQVKLVPASQIVHTIG